MEQWSLMLCAHPLTSNVANWEFNIIFLKRKINIRNTLLFPFCFPLLQVNYISPLVLPAPIVQFTLRISFQFAALLEWGIQYIERDFACIWFRFFSWWLKAWSPCCPLPVLSSSQGTPLPLFPGWSSVRVKRVGNRQGYRLQPSLTPMWSPGSSAAPPPPTLPVSGALTQSCVGGCPTLFASTPLHLGRCNTHPKSGAEQTGELWVLVCLQVKSSALRVQYDSNPKRRRGVVSQSHDKKGAEKAWARQLKAKLWISSWILANARN